MKMPAITVPQPCATLLASGAIRVCPRYDDTDYSGRIAIHAGAQVSDAGRALAEHAAVHAAIVAAGYQSWSCLPTRAVIAVCKRVEVVSHWDRPCLNELERLVATRVGGRYLWVFEDVTPLASPVRAWGKVGVWEIDLDAPEVCHGL